MSEDKPWRDESKLQELYAQKGYSTTEIGEKFNCSPRTVGNWLKRFDIEVNKCPSKKHGCMWYDRPKSDNSIWNKTYEYFQHEYQGEAVMVSISRLVMVAEKGLESIKGNHVHHKNKCPYDNRAENLEIISPEKHNKLHHAD